MGFQEEWGAMVKITVKRKRLKRMQILKMLARRKAARNLKKGKDIDMKMINFKDIPEDDFPLVILIDDKRSFLGFAIKARSGGNYSHIMDMYRPGICATQSPLGFKDIKISRYLQPQFQVKAWCYEGATDEQKQAWKDIIKLGLKEPWYKRAYDFLGIIGYLIPGKLSRKINIPWLKYCSERVAEHLRAVFNINIPKHSSPVEINKILKKHPKFKVYGYWFEK